MHPSNVEFVIKVDRRQPNTHDIVQQVKTRQLLVKRQPTSVTEQNSISNSR